jgi:hypothetical protein
MWFKGFSLFADGTLEEVQKVSFAMSRVKEVLIKTVKFQKEEVNLLYVAPLEFPYVPTGYWYNCIEPLEGSYLRSMDIRSNTVGSWRVP